MSATTQQGGWRGRGRGMRRPEAQVHQRERSLLLPPAPLGLTIDSINLNTLISEVEKPKIEDVQYVASYNWLDVRSAVVLVPGCPRVWSPPDKDYQLKPDSGTPFRDINAARFPSYPMEPAVRSILTMQPDFDCRAIDVVGCGSTLGNLLRFAASKSKPFRFDVDVVGGTVFFIRKEKSPTETINDLQGYGHTFPERYTSWVHDVRNSCSHQRIIKYQLGGLHFLVRTETDGYVHDDTPPIAPPFDLDSALARLSLDDPSCGSRSKVMVEVKGEQVAQEHIFDIKTRASTNIYDMDEILPRLWLNQTRKFLLAYHKFGLFEKPEVKDVRTDVLGWQDKSSHVLGRYHALVKRIIDVVLDQDDGKAEVYWDGEGPLLVTRRAGEGRRVLPDELVKVWEGKAHV